MDEPNDGSEGTEAPEARRPYTAPRLLRYGSLQELTGAGTGSKAENMMGKGSAKKNFM